MTGGRMNGTVPITWRRRASRDRRRQLNQASGNAVATASAAAETAMISEAKSALRHSGSAKIWPYQENDTPCGGKLSVFCALIDTPATTTIGAARKSATSRKNSRRAH